ncbi:MAG TPA: hypothetical protein VFZ73_07425 [Gemmatimonadaceae bacterium]
MPPTTPIPPYTLAAAGFPLRALAALAARSPLGGPREVLLAAMQAARMVEGAAGLHPLPESVRRSRANAARVWLSALALPAASRQVIGRAIECSADSDREALMRSWEAVAAIVAPGADLASRAELKRLTLMLAQTP